MNLSELAQETFIDIRIIENILNDEINYDEIDQFDRELISSALLCQPNYWIDSKVREKDIVNASLNRGINDFNTNKIKAKVQQCTSDLFFLQSLIEKSKR